jgi:hypothetical protein
MTNNPPPPQQPPQPGRPGALRLEIPATLNATYSNGVVITHTNTEIFFDFVQTVPNDPRVRVQHRIIMNPVQAKLFLDALRANIAHYEQKNGEIKTPPKPLSLADQLFSSLQRPDEEPPTNG